MTVALFINKKLTIGPVRFRRSIQIRARSILRTYFKYRRPQKLILEKRSTTRTIYPHPDSGLAVLATVFWRTLVGPSVEASLVVSAAGCSTCTAHQSASATAVHFLDSISRRSFLLLCTCMALRAETCLATGSRWSRLLSPSFHSSHSFFCSIDDCSMNFLEIQMERKEKYTGVRLRWSPLVLQGPRFGAYWRGFFMTLGAWYSHNLLYLKNRSPLVRFSLSPSLLMSTLPRIFGLSFVCFFFSSSLLPPPSSRAISPQRP